MRVALLTVGDELLRGEVVDTLRAELGRALVAAGHDVVDGRTSGDDQAALVRALRDGIDVLGGDGALLVTGGLGPTDDDRTRAALAEVLGVALERDAEAVELLRRRTREVGRGEPGPAQLRQADLPVGATAVPNPYGTAPAVRAEAGSVVVVCLPGVPREARGLLDDEVLPLLAARDPAARARHVRVVPVAGVGESDVADAGADLVAAAGDAVQVGWLASGGVVRVRVSGTPDAREQVDRLADALAERLGDAVLADDPGPAGLPAAAVAALRARGWTVATAESLTAGLVAARLADVPGASAVLRGGVVAYAPEVKRDVLGVPAEVLEDHGTVSDATAASMAQRVRELTGADVGVALTGVAGPDPSEGHPPGRVHVGLVGPGTPASAWSLDVRAGSRGEVRVRAAAAALDAVRRLAERSHPDLSREQLG